MIRDIVLPLLIQIKFLVRIADTSEHVHSAQAAIRRQARSRRRRSLHIPNVRMAGMQRRRTRRVAT